VGLYWFIHQPILPSVSSSASHSVWPFVNPVKVDRKSVVKSRKDADAIGLLTIMALRLGAFKGTTSVCHLIAPRSNGVLSISGRTRGVEIKLKRKGIRMTKLNRGEITASDELMTTALQPIIRHQLIIF
jgi:hypothetical protein